MNFVRELKDGQAGYRMGWTTGIPALDKAIGGIIQKNSYGVAAAPKCGKTRFVNYAFVLSPYLQAEREGRLDEIEWVYFSYEIDRVSTEFDFAAFFMHYDYGVSYFTFEGEEFPMSPTYLKGQKYKVIGVDEKGNEIKRFIPLSEDHNRMLKDIYVRRIIPIFGEYDEDGNKLSTGKIVHYMEVADNPTGMDKFIKWYAAQNGQFIMDNVMINGEVKQIPRAWKPANPRKTHIIVCDHIRKPVIERGFTMKQNIDKWLEYSTALRNMCKFVFVNICHSNRGVANTDRLKFAGEWVFPTADDVKDSGNLAEESTVLMTLFNPNDEKYNLTRHFGVELSNYPNYRSLHITEARYAENIPAHIQLNMYGGLNLFTPLF